MRMYVHWQENPLDMCTHFCTCHFSSFELRESDSGRMSVSAVSRADDTTNMYLYVLYIDICAPFAENYPIESCTLGTRGAVPREKQPSLR